MIVKKPSPCTVLARNGYWASLSQPLPDWCFDFISVHKNGKANYSLLSPTILREKYGRSLGFEKESFATKALAIAKAKEISKLHKLFIIDCV
jgi:hypothetical protein